MSSAEGVLNPETRLGPYRLGHEIGRGGQAVVWLAEDSRIKRRVALKILPALGPGSETVLARFRREAEVTSKLEHPAICPIYEADVQGGVPFIAMRFVEGVTLAQRIAMVRQSGGAAVVLTGEPGAAPDWNAIAAFFAKIARALHCAHEVGVVHRDIKPHNLMVTPEGEPVILDFGLARQDDPESQALSLSGAHSGTPAYMSPEQMTGRFRPDRRSDVYSLGCALFEALTGRPPFEAPTLEGLLHAILSSDAPGVSRVHAAVPEDLAVITATAIEKERERRYKTALDFALDLERFGRLEPIAARPITTSQRVARWSRRNPALAAALLAAVVLGLLATGLLSYGIGAAGRAELEAELRRRSEAERELMVQAVADRDLAGRLDELNMKFGTLMFGFGGGNEGVLALVPAFEAILREVGIDLARPDVVAVGRASIEKLRSRAADPANALIHTLRNLGSISSFDATARSRLQQLLEPYQDPRMEPIFAARSKWLAEQVDEFGPLVAEQKLTNMDPDLLAEIGALLLQVTGREEQGWKLLDRAILARPDSFPLHYLSGGLAISQAAKDMAGKAGERLARTAVMHFQTAMALRPRSSLARASLSGAQALLAAITREEQGFVTAWATMESAIEVDPKNAIVWFFRADFLRRSPGRKAMAIESCKKSLQLDPNFTPASRLLEELSR